MACRQGGVQTASHLQCLRATRRRVQRGERPRDWAKGAQKTWGSKPEESATVFIFHLESQQQRSWPEARAQAAPRGRRAPFLLPTVSVPQVPKWTCTAPATSSLCWDGILISPEAGEEGRAPMKAPEEVLLDFGPQGFRGDPYVGRPREPSPSLRQPH